MSLEDMDLLMKDEGSRAGRGVEGSPRACQHTCTSLSKHRGDVKVKLGRGPYAISIAILIMRAGFQHPRTKYMIAPNILLFSHVFFHVVIQISVE